MISIHAPILCFFTVEMRVEATSHIPRKKKTSGIFEHAWLQFADNMNTICKAIESVTGNLICDLMITGKITRRSHKVREKCTRQTSYTDCDCGVLIFS